MKLIYFLLFSVILIHNSCYDQKNIETLNENLEFETRFLECINNIEAYTLNKKNNDSVYINLILFKNCLDSISRFVKIDYTKLTNYDFRYVNYKAYYRDKERWLKWFEENKNLRW